MKILLEIMDVARMLDLSGSGVRAIVKRGELTPAFKTPRGVKLFTVESVKVLEKERWR